MSRLEKLHAANRVQVVLLVQQAETPNWEETM